MSYLLNYRLPVEKIRVDNVILMIYLSLMAFLILLGVIYVKYTTEAPDTNLVITV